MCQQRCCYDVQVNAAAVSTLVLLCQRHNGTGRNGSSAYADNTVYSVKPHAVTWPVRPIRVYVPSLGVTDIMSPVRHVSIEQCARQSECSSDSAVHSCCHA
eukprot:14749-Heterococcus_DN1.PRE.5